MPQVVQPTSIVKNYTTTTDKGEITVNLNLALTIKLENGEIAVSTVGKKIEKDTTPDYIPQIPIWEPVSEKDLIDFGKDAL